MQAAGLPQGKNDFRQKTWRTSGKSVLSLCPAVSTVHESRHVRESFSSSFAFSWRTPAERRPTGLSQRTAKSNSRYDGERQFKSLSSEAASA